MIKVDKTHYTATRQSVKANIQHLKSGMATQLKALRQVNANPLESEKTAVVSRFPKVQAKGSIN